MAAQKFGRWRIMGPLDEGGQAHTFLVVQPDNPNEICVLKRLKNVVRLPRFQREVAVLRISDHPNILKIIDADLGSPKPYFISPYYENGSLAKFPISALTLEKKIAFFRAICDGVAYAHAAGIVHRDIKPANIYVTGNVEPIVGDFGICYIEDGERHTLLDEAVGAARFMAPEVENGREEEVSPASDVYSLGKLLYWIISGRIFSRERHREKDYDIYQKDPRLEIALINELLDKLIVADVRARPKDAGVVVSEIELLQRRIDMKAHVLDASIPQHCNYCGNGNYRPIVNSTPGGVSPSTVHNFGFNGVGSAVWLIMVCDNCANVQIFRPDYNGGGRAGDTKWAKFALGR
jgi:serine/threonine protein kinase